MSGKGQKEHLMPVDDGPANAQTHWLAIREGDPALGAIGPAGVIGSAGSATSRLGYKETGRKR